MSLAQHKLFIMIIINTISVHERDICLVKVMFVPRCKQRTKNKARLDNRAHDFKLAIS